MTRSLDLEVTRRCNLRCDFCFVGWSRDWTTDLPEEVALGATREGAGLFPVLHLTGGEPFAYRALFDVIEEGAALGYDEILVNTNATLVTDNVADRLAAYGDRVATTVSLDGPEPLHDRVRGEGRYREASAGLARLLARGVRSTVATVVTPEVLRALPGFVAEIRRAHPRVAGITLFPVGVGPAGTRKPGASIARLSPAELTELALAVALLRRTGVRIGIGAYPIANLLLRGFGYPEDELYACTAGRGRVCVHADRSVSTCHPVKDPIYGTWRPGLLRELAAVPAHARMAARDFDGCRDCDDKESCGHCRAFVTASGAPLFGNDEVCRRVHLPIAH